MFCRFFSFSHLLTRVTEKYILPLTKNTIDSMSLFFVLQIQGSPTKSYAVTAITLALYRKATVSVSVSKLAQWPVSEGRTDNR